MKQKILLVEHDSLGRVTLAGHLAREGYAVNLASDLERAEEDLRARLFDAVILGVDLPDGPELALIESIRSFDRFLPIIALTGASEIAVAVDAVRKGADNVVAKPIDLTALSVTLERLLREDSLRATKPSRLSSIRKSGDGMAGEVPFPRGLRALAASVAASDAPLIIAGETGTGKGHLARWMHRNGRRSGLRFAGVNCSGIHDDLLIAQIFGTSASGEPPLRRGLVDAAGLGTLFLDEIADLSLPLQERLLNLLEERRAPLPFRLVCSSNQDLAALAATGAFLPRLLERLSVTRVGIPPLRERRRELAGIIRRLVSWLSGGTAAIADDALTLLKGYSWPGNMRELINAIEQALLVSRGANLTAGHFSWMRHRLSAGDRRPVLTAGRPHKAQAGGQSSANSSPILARSSTEAAPF